MKREHGLDLLRVICCFLVVLMHSCSYPFLTAPINSIGWYTSMIYDYLGFIAVPVFFMLSGYFMLNLNKKITYRYLMKKIIFILAAYFFWSFIYFVWKHKLYIFNNVQFSVPFIKTMIQELITAQPHFWFISNLLGLYILIPVYRKLIEDKLLTKYYLAVFFVIFFVLKPLTPIYPFSAIFDFINSFGFSKLFGFSVYFVLGGIIKNYNIRSYKLLYVTGMASMIFMIISNVIYSYLLNVKGQFLCDYLHPFVFISTIATFVFFMNIKITNKKVQNKVAYLSNLTMGIYYLHMITYYSLTGLGIYFLPLPAILSIPLSAVSNFIITGCIIAIVHKVPVLGKYVV